MVRAILAGTAISLMASGAVIAQDSDEGTTACGAPVAHYLVRYAGEDRFEVEAQFSSPRMRWDLAHFPTPDRPEAQATSVHDLEAYGEAGDALPIDYVGEGGWETEAGATRITYTLLADHNQVDWNIQAPGKDEVGDHFDESYVFAGHAFFLLDWGMPRCAVDVDFELPEGWRVTAPWPERGDGFRLEDSWDLGQNLFAMGLDAPRETETGGLSLTWLMDSRLGDIAPRAEAVLDVLPDAYTEFWGEAGGEAFSIFFMSDYMSDGGAFYDSFALRIATPANSADIVSWSHTLGHELMHIWNPLAKANGANVPELEWVNEGFTDYLTIKLMAQTGLLEPAMVEQRLANIVRRYQLAGRLNPGVSLEAGGLDKGSNWHAIYGPGALVALLLDAELSQSDPHAFRDALRALRQGLGSGYTYESFLAAFDAQTNGRASEIVAWVDARPSNGELIARFGELGMDLSIFALDEAYVRVQGCGDTPCLPAFLSPQ